MFLSPDEEIVIRTLSKNKIKRAVIEKLLDDEVENIGQFKSVTIHVDLTYILHPLYSEYFDKILTDKQHEFLIASAVINTIAHYRNMFAKKECGALTTEFICYYGTGKFYKKYETSEYTNISARVGDTIELLKVILPYLPSVSIVETKEPVLAAYHIIENEISSEFNIFITGDDAWLQLLGAENITPVVLVPNKDESVMYTKSNFTSHILASKKYLNTNEFDPGLIPIIQSYIGWKFRQSKPIKKAGPAKIMKLLDDAITSSAIVNGLYQDPYMLIDDMRLPDSELFVETYPKFLLIGSTEKDYTLSSAETKRIRDSLEMRRYAHEDLQLLNVKYFTGDISLMLNELVVGPKRNISIKW